MHPEGRIGYRDVRVGTVGEATSTAWWTATITTLTNLWRNLVSGPSERGGECTGCLVHPCWGSQRSIREWWWGWVVEISPPVSGCARPVEIFAANLRTQTYIAYLLGRDGLRTSP